ncbi:MAG: TonB C-terminal domain-containing protein [Sulfuricaulis sp.]
MTVMTSFTADSGAQRVHAHKSFFWRPQYLLGGVLFLLLAAGVYGIINIVTAKAPPRMEQVVQHISLLPPPPPPVEQPPQPEIKQEVNMPPPQPVAQDNAPPPGDLGVDGNATGSDGFALRARKGGRGLLDSNPFSSFNSRMEDTIRKALYSDKNVRGTNYVVEVRLWLGHDGRVERSELAGSTGNPKIDQNLKLALSKVASIGEEVPADLPQPVRMQITWRQ